MYKLCIRETQNSPQTITSYFIISLSPVIITFVTQGVEWVRYLPTLLDTKQSTHNGILVYHQFIISLSPVKITSSHKVLNELDIFQLS